MIRRSGLKKHAKATQFLLSFKWKTHAQSTGMIVTISKDGRRLWKFYQNIYFHIRIGDVAIFSSLTVDILTRLCILVCVSLGACVCMCVCGHTYIQYLIFTNIQNSHHICICKIFIIFSYAAISISPTALNLRGLPQV